MTSGWFSAPPDSIWRITGKYRGYGTFENCLAIVLDPAVTGSEHTTFAMLPPLAWNRGMCEKTITPDRISSAELVVLDPWDAQRRVLTRMADQGEPTREGFDSDFDVDDDGLIATRDRGENCV